jgi:mRNA-degrading endonuclease RelE of RelBE toxin-antitoxin system
VKSQTTAAFRKRFASLPADVRAQARGAYRLFISNPHHPSLRFKRVHDSEPVYSARVGRSYRVVGLIEDGNVIVWFWIGPHEQYETLLANL